MKKILIIAFAGMIAACSTPAPEKTVRPVVVSNGTKSQPRVIIPISAAQEESVKKAVSETLKDPYSAVFTGIYGTSINPNSDGSTVYCGTVNAKNAYGGYTGAKKFALILGNTYLWSDIESGFSAADNEFITSICTPEKT